MANRNITLWYEKAPVYRFSRSKAPKTQQICYYRHTLPTQVPLQKFRFLFIFIIPWYTALISKSCNLLAINSYCLMGTKAVVVVIHEYNELVVVVSVAH